MEQIIYSIALIIAILLFAVVLRCYHHSKKYRTKSFILHTILTLGFILLPTIFVIIARIITQETFVYLNQLNMAQAIFAIMVMIPCIHRMIWIDKIDKTKYREIRKCCFIYDFNNAMTLNNRKLLFLISPTIIAYAVVLGGYLSSVIEEFADHMSGLAIFAIIGGAVFIIVFAVWIYDLIWSYAKY